MQNYKSSRRYTGENLGDLWYGKDFWDTTLKPWSIEDIIDKLDIIKIKDFC